MNRVKSILLLVLVITVVVAQSELEKELFPKLDKAMKLYSYDWEPHRIETKDGWYLHIFRITGING